MPADSVKLVCYVVRDTMEYAEGDLYRVMVVAVGRDTLRVGIDRDRVNSVQVRTARFTTVDSLRVGISLARLRAYPAMEGGLGEGEYYVYDDVDPRTCGLSFRVDLGSRSLTSIPNGLVRDFPTDLLTLEIDQIFARGCYK
ncbi:MAG TPA: hypothetical protein VGM67_18410 [Gemmatimonadaceae bacterium]